jgi:hypothetical protein
MDLLLFHGQPLLAIALLVALVPGAVVVLALGAGRILQLRLVSRSAPSRNQAFPTNRQSEDAPPRLPRGQRKSLAEG